MMLLISHTITMDLPDSGMNVQRCDAAVLYTVYAVTRPAHQAPATCIRWAE